MSKIIINPDLCKKCSTCVQSCPETIFVKEEKDSIPEFTHVELCLSCGHCVAICPQGAISHGDFPSGSIKAVNQEILPFSEQIIEMVRTRRSIREFMDKPVEKELIEKIIDGAHFAPSDHNVQSTEFVVVQNKEVLDKIVELTVSYLAKTLKQFHNPLIRRLLLIVAKNEVEGALHLQPDLDRVVNEVLNGKDTVLFNAPALLLFHADKNINRSDVNASLALANASLVIQGLGLGSFYAGYLVSACKRDNSIPNLLSIPTKNQIYGALALGYPKFKYKNWIERRPPKIKWI